MKQDTDRPEATTEELLEMNEDVREKIAAALEVATALWMRTGDGTWASEKSAATMDGLRSVAALADVTRDALLKHGAGYVPLRW